MTVAKLEALIGSMVQNATVSATEASIGAVVTVAWVGLDTVTMNVPSYIMENPVGLREYLAARLKRIVASRAMERWLTND